MTRVTDPAAYTPVERHGEHFYKRDDLFLPYDDVPVSGGKVRQAMLLLANRREHILAERGGWVLTASSVHSPQGLIIARVAIALGLRCRVFAGGAGRATPASSAVSHPLMRRILEVGGQLDTSTGLGYAGPLAASMDRWRQAHGGAGFIVKFGINLENDRAAILGSIADQTANIPAEVTQVVIPVGSGITAAGIIVGLRQRRPDIAITCIQISGKDQRPTIDSITGERGGYRWHQINDIPYAKLVPRRVGDFDLDPIYEAKAHDVMLADPRLRGALFWLVGNSAPCRVRGPAPRPTTGPAPALGAGAGGLSRAVG